MPLKYLDQILSSFNSFLLCIHWKSDTSNPGRTSPQSIYPPRYLIQLNSQRPALHTGTCLTLLISSHANSYIMKAYMIPKIIVALILKTCFYFLDLTSPCLSDFSHSNYSSISNMKEPLT